MVHLLSLYFNDQVFHLNLALNSTQKNFQNFANDISVNLIFEIIFSSEFETEEEGTLLIYTRLQC